ncbi:glycosyltransferase [Paenibacillus humicola]|uniref:glycosyltransferase n=1 Tax=Paenibacillus humicola TaxID=3110540 RepID=UPI00237BB9A8|nr:glycosyltransferase family 2 protein [Paenibacillus humicola]
MVFELIAAVVGLVSLAYWGYHLAISYRGLKLVERLPAGKALKLYPKVSIVVAVKDEAPKIGTTLLRLMELDYPDYEIVVVNDRSTDGTQLELDRLVQAGHSKLNVVQITALPEGWLGKNHALYQGYLASKGDYLLFTDADVIFQPNALRDAMSDVLHEKIDHLTLSPRFISKTLVLRLFVHYFIFFIILYLRAWKANLDTQRKEGLGIGAFNLISRDAYRKIGTHQSISMAPDDDLQLGTMVKKAGLKQRFRMGIGHIEVEWYESFHQAMRGLEKNVYAGFRYNLFFVASAIIGLLLLGVAPYVMVWFLSGWVLAVHLLAILCMLVLYGYSLTKEAVYKPVEIALFPVAVLLCLWVLARSAFLAEKRKGMYWRGTFYPLNELKEHMRRVDRVKFD